MLREVVLQKSKQDNKYAVLTERYARSRYDSLNSDSRQPCPDDGRVHCLTCSVDGGFPSHWKRG
ncbi:hypothetical protein Pla110_06960 [Polystyrenella longa]|uniref:Uncharacterized protein n=1 Tax=Polystyrenella longa TaxID=2528007 RepID=A0A518CIF0_9PLAN|nr:hypothetical protein Pla110_06960 [Polystyrenella longa]